MNESRKAVNGWKICARCEQEKLLAAFGKRSSSGDGYQYWCRECVRSQQRARYVNSRESGRLDRVQAKLGEYKAVPLKPVPPGIDVKTLPLLDEDNPMDIQNKPSS